MLTLREEPCQNVLKTFPVRWVWKFCMDNIFFKIVKTNMFLALDIYIGYTLKTEVSPLKSAVFDSAVIYNWYV